MTFTGHSAPWRPVTFSVFTTKTSFALRSSAAKSAKTAVPIAMCAANAGKFDLLAIVATSGEIHYVKDFLIDSFKRPLIRRASVPEKSDPIDPSQTELKSDVIDSAGVQ